MSKLKIFGHLLSVITFICIIGTFIFHKSWITYGAFCLVGAIACYKIEED